MPEIRERKQGEKFKGKGGTPAAGKDLRQQMTSKFRKELMEQAQNHDGDYAETPETEATEQVQDAALSTGREIKDHTVNTISHTFKKGKQRREKETENQRPASPRGEAAIRESSPHSAPYSTPPARQRMTRKATEDLRVRHTEAGQEQPAPKERRPADNPRERPAKPRADRRDTPQPSATPAQNRMRQAAVNELREKRTEAVKEPPAPKERPTATITHEKSVQSFTPHTDTPAPPLAKERTPLTAEIGLREKRVETIREAPAPKERPAAAITHEETTQDFTPRINTPAQPAPRERMRKTAIKEKKTQPAEIPERQHNPVERTKPTAETQPVNTPPPETPISGERIAAQPRSFHSEKPVPATSKVPEPAPAKPVQAPAQIRDDTPAPPQPEERMRQKAIKEKSKGVRQRQTSQVQQAPDAPIREKTPDSTLSTDRPAPPPGKRMLESARNRRAEESRRQLPQSVEASPEHIPTFKSIPEKYSPSIKTQSINPSIKERPRRGISPKEKPAGGAFVPKTRQSAVIQTRAANKAAPKPAAGGKRTARQIRDKARQRVQRNAQRKMLQNSKTAAKTAGKISKKAVEVTAKAAKALISALAGLLGGGMLIPVILVVILVAAIIASPFGILFSNEPTPNAMPLNIAIGQIRREFSNKLEELQDGEYDDIQIEGQPPDWREVVAVFAAKTAAADNGVDVAALTPDRVELLRTVFWDMCSVTSEVETTDYPDSNPDDEEDDSYSESVLKITITAKTADDMRTEYSFNDNQNSALTELTAELSTMEILVTDLTASEEHARELRKNIPDDLAPERRAVVETACELVGKVTYFWGGKSLVIGWDDRWGVVTKVTAADSPTTGTYRPYGLDCSGFVDWVFYNATDGAYYPGHGGGTNSQLANSTQISWDEALPGDLVFYSDVSHVGIVGGKDADGNFLIIHCTSGSINGTTITGAGGFGSVARPSFYTS